MRIPFADHSTVTRLMAEKRTYKPTGELDGIVIEEMPIHEAETKRIVAQASVPEGETEGDCGDAEALAAAGALLDDVVEKRKHWLARWRDRVKGED